MYKVSVIIPVYGVEKYIERCARSLFEQTLEEIEFIFVNDCTKDDSITILERVVDDYPKRKKDVLILHHEQNKGLPAARHTGILRATGEFVAHCDSDDWLELDAYKLMYEKAVLEDADVVVCDYQGNDGERVERIETGLRTTDKEAFLRSLMFQRCSWSLWNKLVRRTTCYKEDIIFPKANMGEDMLLCVQLLLNAKRISYIPYPIYNYFNNKGSISRTLDLNKVHINIIQLLDNTNAVISVLDGKDLSTKYKKEIYWLKYNVKLNAMRLCVTKKYYHFWCSIYPEINSRVWFMPVKMKDKLMYYIILSGLYSIIHNEN